MRKWRFAEDFNLWINFNQMSTTAAWSLCFCWIQREHGGGWRRKGGQTVSELCKSKDSGQRWHWSVGELRELTTHVEVKQKLYWYAGELRELAAHAAHNWRGVQPCCHPPPPRPLPAPSPPPPRSSLGYIVGRNLLEMYSLLQDASLGYM